MRRGVCLSLLLGVVALLAPEVACDPQDKNSTSHPTKEYSGYDGWYNNIAYPQLGIVDSHLIRSAPSCYQDGAYEPRGGFHPDESVIPNPMRISEKTMQGPTGEASALARSALLVYFGQQVVEEVLDSQGRGCPIEYVNIPIRGDIDEEPTCHEIYNPQGEQDKFIPVQRTRFDQNTGDSPNNPRQQLNEITPYIDGGLTYGIAKVWSDTLRKFRRGYLAWTCDAKFASGDCEVAEIHEMFPITNDIGLPLANPPPSLENVLKPVRRFMRLGNPRGMENPYLLMMGIVWFRYHNKLARDLFEERGCTSENEHDRFECSDEAIFNEARQWLISVHQKVVFYDWLPAFLGQPICADDETDTSNCIPQFRTYNPTITAQISQEFQTSAMRWGHTLVTPGGWLREKNSEDGECGKFKLPIRTCNSYWNSIEYYKEHPFQDLGDGNRYDGEKLDDLVRGLSSQRAEKEDNIITPDLRGFVFGPLEQSRRDLMALNIQRGRDHGVPDYQSVRMALGLELKKTFRDINPARPDPLVRLAALYGKDIDDEIGQSQIDLWPGGLLETVNGPGETFTAIIKDQFIRIRDGDRFWFESQKNGYSSWPHEIVEKIMAVTFRDVLLDVTGVTEEELQDPFFVDELTCMEPGRLRNNMTREELIEMVEGHNGEPLEDEDRWLPYGNPDQPNEDYPDYLGWACSYPKGFDYFSDSETDIIWVVMSFVCVFLIVLLIAIFLVERRKGRDYRKIVHSLRNFVRSAFHSSENRPGSTQDNYFMLSELIVEVQSIVLAYRDKLDRTIVMEDNDSKALWMDFQTFAVSVIGEEAVSRWTYEDGYLTFDRSDFAHAMKLQKDSDIVQYVFLLLTGDDRGLEISLQEYGLFLLIGVPYTRVDDMLSTSESLSFDIHTGPAGAVTLSVTQETGEGASAARDQGSFIGRTFKRVAEVNRGFWAHVDEHVVFYRLQMVWYAVLIFTFLERFWFYSQQAENGGFRQITGWGVPITRGAAAAQIWAYSTLLLPMARNTAAYLRHTALNKIWPFDYAWELHKHWAVVGMVFSIVHVAVHCNNFINIATQPESDLACTFREVFVGTHEDRDLSWWVFNTATGITGYMLTVVLIMIMVWSHRSVRKWAFWLFWLSHQLLWPLFYGLLFLHGAAHLVQYPWWIFFSVFPLALLTFDKLYGLYIYGDAVEVDQKATEELPSGVIKLALKKPPRFTYEAGMWLKIAINESSSMFGSRLARATNNIFGFGYVTGTSDYHSFTITSAPHEPSLTMHIRKVGPFTSKVHEAYSKSPIELQHKSVFIQGPFGEGFQDWDEFRTVLIFGSGIGITPVISVVKDVIQKRKTGQIKKCEKVYLVWIAQNLAEWEWVHDVLRQCELEDQLFAERTGTEPILTIFTFFTDHFQHPCTTLLYMLTAVDDDVKYREGLGGRHLLSSRFTYFGRPNILKLMRHIATLEEDRVFDECLLAYPVLENDLAQRYHREFGVDLPEDIMERREALKTVWPEKRRIAAFGCGPVVNDMFRARKQYNENPTRFAPRYHAYGTQF